MNANFVSSFLHLDLNGDGVEDDIQCLNQDVQPVACGPQCGPPGV